MGPEPKWSLAGAIRRALSGWRNEVAPDSLGGQHNPFRMDPVTVQAEAAPGAVQRDASAQVNPPRRMHGLSMLAPMVAQQRGEAPNPQRVFARHGVLPQMAAQDTARARRIYEAVEPWDYEVRPGTPLRAARALLGLENSPRSQAPYPGSEDAWRVYLGLPQLHGSLEPSQHRPSRSSDQNATYFRLREFPEKRSALGGTPELRDLIQLASEGGTADINPTLGNYTIGLGEDEKGKYLSYYDRWDLDPQALSGSVVSSAANYVADRVGTPYEVYDRIYYDPETYERRDPQPTPPQRGLRPPREQGFLSRIRNP